MPDSAAVLKLLRSKGTAQNRKVYARHGWPEPLCGVSFADLRALAKRLGTDQALAQDLWSSGVADARVLATMVADAPSMTRRELEAWLADIRFYTLADLFSALVARSPLRRALCDAWRDSRDDFTGQAGWNLVGLLAMQGEVGPEFLAARLKDIGSDLHGAPNRTRHAMNMALAAIGGHCEPLRKRALALARRLGKVHVDHGETGCKTPDAAGYIAKIAAHRAQAAGSPARAARSPAAGQPRVVTAAAAARARRAAARPAGRTRRAR